MRQNGEFSATKFHLCPEKWELPARGTRIPSPSRLRGHLSPRRRHPTVAFFTLEPLLHPRQLLAPVVACPFLPVGVVKQIECLDEMANLRDALLQAGAFLARLGGRQAGAADGKGLGVEREFVLHVVA